MFSKHAERHQIIKKVWVVLGINKNDKEARGMCLYFHLTLIFFFFLENVKITVFLAKLTFRLRPHDRTLVDVMPEAEKQRAK